MPRVGIASDLGLGLGLHSGGLGGLGLGQMPRLHIEHVEQGWVPPTVHHNGVPRCHSPISLELLLQEGLQLRNSTRTLQVGGALGLLEFTWI